MTRTRYKFGDATSPHFLTCTVVGWMPVFTRPETMDIVLNSWRFLQDRGRLTIHAYVVLENHVHLIASGNDLGKEIGDFKSFTARQIIELFEARNVRMFLDQLRYYKAAHKVDREYQFWQEGSHPEMILDDKMMWQKIEYIHNNPVKRGYVDDPTHWRYSSARNYANQPGLLHVVTEW
ncbi:MAG TPA: transposase [Pirellulales bacterium]|nr:transposase [Pirellulales bacterium]